MNENGMVKLSSISKSQMKSKIEDWLKQVHNSGYWIKDLYKFEDGGKNRFKFYIDGQVYDIINDYMTDGYDPFGLGEKFESITEGTGWDFEFLFPSIINFYRLSRSASIVQAQSPEFDKPSEYSSTNESPTVPESDFENNATPPGEEEGLENLDTVPSDQGTPTSPSPPAPEEKAPEPKKKITDVLKPVDLQMYYDLVSRRDAAESVMDLSTVEYVNSMIERMMKKYLSSPPIANPDILHGSIKKASMKNNEDYTLFVVASREFWKALSNVQIPRPESASIVNIERYPNSYMYTISGLFRTPLPSRKEGLIKIEVYDKDKVDVIPYIWDSLGNRYSLDSAGVKEFLGDREFNVQDYLDELGLNVKEERE